MCAIKRKLKFEDYKICLEATQLEKITNYLEKHEIDVYSPKEDHKELIKNNRLILKTQQRFKNERHNAFTEEINKIALSSDDDKRMKSIDSIETKLATNSWSSIHNINNWRLRIWRNKFIVYSNESPSRYW